MIHNSTIAYVGIALFVLGVSAIFWLGLRPGAPAFRKLLRHHKALERELKALYVPLSANKFVSLWISTMVALLVAAFIVEPLCVALALIVAVAPLWLLPYLRKRRSAQLEAQLPAWLSILSNFLKVSGSVSDSLRQTVDMTRGPLGQELDLLLKELRLGNPLPEALKNTAARVQSTVFSTVVAIILVGRKTGGELPNVLNETAASLRERMRLEGVLRKQTAMGRSQMVILFISPPVIIFMFEKADPGFFRPLVEGGFLGQLIMASAALMWLGAMFAARKILAVDL